MTDTIPAPAPEHNERCRHSDCVGECCEPCANMPKARAHAFPCPQIPMCAQCWAAEQKPACEACPVEASSGFLGLPGRVWKCTVCEATWKDGERYSETKQPSGMTERDRGAEAMHNAGMMAGYGFTSVPLSAMEPSQRREALVLLVWWLGRPQTWR